MRNPANVLNSLSKHSKITGYKFGRLYRVLFNKEMFYIAYQNIYAKPGNMTKGSDGKTIDEMSLERIDNIIDMLRNETYQPNPSRRTYIDKKNGKKRPLGIPSFDDKLVQEVIRMMFEAIYEGSFEYTSHGFRPNRSCHTALLQIQKSFSGTKWFIEGDIKEFFDNINHNILISILKERIEDERFIRLIRKFLNAGYIEDWKYYNTYSGTPQGGIMSPVLANIYLDKLDKYMREYAQTFNKGEHRKRNPEYLSYDNKKCNLCRKLKVTEGEDQRTELIKQIRELVKNKLSVPFGVEMDNQYKRLNYVRYADDFLIGIIGSKEECTQIKQDIRCFLAEKLMLELSDEKTLITHAETAAKFLNYEVYVRKTNNTRRGRTGALKRAFNKRIVLKLPNKVMRDKLIYYGVVEFVQHNGFENWKPFPRNRLLNNDDLEILMRYNSEIEGLYNYYSIANNSSAMHSFSYIMQYSMYKTFAKKHKTSKRKLLPSYMRNGVFTVFFTNKKGVRRPRTFYNGGFKRKTTAINNYSDTLPKTMFTSGGTSLIDRLKARKCELCENENDLEMHHIRKLKDLKGKTPWERHMIARQRKTMAVCFDCHRRIHNGG